MIGDRDYDVCMRGHIRAAHEGDGDGKGPCAHYDPCPCKSFVMDARISF